jgi:hypothetical protein
MAPQRPGARWQVSAARTLCTCHPVAAVKSLIAAPSGRSSGPRMAAFFDWRIGTVTEPALALAGERMLQRSAVLRVRDLEEGSLKGSNAWDGPYYPHARGG